MTGTRLLLDEHVGRILERLLRERGFEVLQAKDQFGEHTEDAALLQWCSEEGVALVSNNAKDFERLHETEDHPGILLYYDQNLPDADPRDWPERWTKYSTSTDQRASRTRLSISTSGTAGSTRDGTWLLGA